MFASLVLLCCAFPPTALCSQRVFQSLGRQLFQSAPDLKTGKGSWTPKQIFDALVNVDGGCRVLLREKQTSLQLLECISRTAGCEPHAR